MPESVDSPAPVRTTSRGPSRTSGTATSRATVIGTEQPSARVAGAGAGPRLLRLDVAVLRWRGGHPVVEQVLGDVGDLVDGPVERLLVRRRRPGRAAHLADELHGGGRDLRGGGRRLEVVQRADVAAHGSSLR